MKKLIVFILPLIFFGMKVGNAQSKSVDAYTVQVDGLGCPFCAYGLEKKFKELKGIKTVKIELEEGMLDFSYPSSTPLTIAQVEKQVEKAGYTPVQITIKRADGKIEKSAKKTVAKQSANGKTVSLSFYVAGNCNMCKARIEKAANAVKGVENASWNKKSKKLMVKASKNVKQLDIEKAIAKAGHDTKNVKANDAKYESLPGCCHYDRIK